MTVPNIIDLTDALPHRPYRARVLQRIRWVVMHHTVGKDNPATPGYEPETVTPLSLAEYHLSLGWAGIGYNYLIYRLYGGVEGQILKVRPVGVTPACVEGHNLESVCIAYVGNLSERRPSAAMLDSGHWLSAFLRKTYPWILGVKGHRELYPTACPGTYLDLDAFRAAVDSTVVA
jgi:hypothetical protein